MEVLMSGEIYIKRGSEEFALSSQDIELFSNLDKISEAKFKVLNKMTNGETTREELKMLSEFFQSLSQKKQIKSYLGCEQFWLSTINKNSIKMAAIVYHEYYGGNGELFTRRFNNKSEIDKKFIKLTTFLDQAEYIGKYFKRTSKVEDHDDSYMRRIPLIKKKSPLILYRLGDRLLGIEDYSPELGGRQFCLISPRYTEDENYEFFGKTNKDYQDKPKVYQSILKQTYEFKTKKRD